MKTYRGNC